MKKLLAIFALTLAAFGCSEDKITTPANQLPQVVDTCTGYNTDTQWRVWNNGLVEV